MLEYPVCPLAVWSEFSPCMDAGMLIVTVLLSSNVTVNVVGALMGSLPGRKLTGHDCRKHIPSDHWQIFRAVRHSHAWRERVRQSVVLMPLLLSRWLRSARGIPCR